MDVAQLDLLQKLQQPLVRPDIEIGTAAPHLDDGGHDDVGILDGASPRRLSQVEAMNVNLPGACWNRDGEIVFVSDTDDHDEVWITDLAGQPVG